MAEISAEILKLYRSSGVNTESFEFRVAVRWNEVSFDDRKSMLLSIGEDPIYAGRRFFELSEVLQARIIRVSQIRAKRRSKRGNQ